MSGNTAGEPELCILGAGNRSGGRSPGGATKRTFVIENVSLWSATRAGGGNAESIEAGTGVRNPLSSAANDTEDTVVGRESTGLTRGPKKRPRPKQQRTTPVPLFRSVECDGDILTSFPILLRLQIRVQPLDTESKHPIRPKAHD